MTEVTKKKFYDTVGILNVRVSVENVHTYPYTSLFKMGNGKLMGKVVGSYTNGIKNQYPIISKYYLSN